MVANIAILPIPFHSNILFQLRFEEHRLQDLVRFADLSRAYVFVSLRRLAVCSRTTALTTRHQASGIIYCPEFFFQNNETI